jgi:Ca2+-binding EF-hand superfamily protein
MQANGFTIDKQEYQSVFKVFDRENTGELTIAQVSNFIGKFEQIQVGSDSLPKANSSPSRRLQQAPVTGFSALPNG